MRWMAAVALLVAAAALLRPSPHRKATRLPAGVLEIHSEIIVDGDLAGHPSGSVLRMASDFHGRAAIVVRGNDVRLRDFTIVGNRDTNEIRTGLPPYDVPFARFTTGNGVLVEGASDVTVERLTLREIAGFAVLVSRSQHVVIDGVIVRDSGSRDARGRNNATGGILLEEGTTDFRVANCHLSYIRGNGIWTHSLYTSARNRRGLFDRNGLFYIGRDALQVGHAFDVRVENNHGGDIGWPADIQDATPVAIDTAGNVERSAYTGNRFTNVYGKCIDLDGFHDGDVRANVCRNISGYGVVMNNTNPDMRSRNIRVVENTFENVQYGGIFVVGSGHLIARNRLSKVALCDEKAACSYLPTEPDMLRSGVYLGKGAERPAPAHGNVVEDNVIQGVHMRDRCVTSAPGVGPNVIRNNICRD